MYIEQDCVITHEGKRYEAEGAFVTPDRLFAYLKQIGGRWVVTDWHGNVLTEDVTILSIRPHHGWISDKRIYLRCTIDGVTYSGIGFGDGIYFRARRVKHKQK